LKKDEPIIIETDEERRSRFNLNMASELLNNHAHQLKDKHQFYTAKIALKRAIGISPNAAILYNHLGAVLWDLGEYDEAKVALEKSLEMDPDAAPTCSNYASLLISLRQYDKSLEYFDKAIRLADEKQSLHARWDRSMMLLDAGKWKEGLADYDVRVEYRRMLSGGHDAGYPNTPYPMWNGEDLNGKTLFVLGEQGIGDRILHSRYLIWLKGKYPSCRILFLASMPGMSQLENLMWGFHEFIEFMPNGVPWPKADYSIFLCSIARLHGTTVDNVPPDPGLIKKRALISASDVLLANPHVPCIKIGVCWTGNAEMGRNADRTIPLELMLELEELPFVQLYALQFGEGHKDIKRLHAEQLLVDLAPDISKNHGIVDTAAAMLNMDLIITACTLNAHLAGVLDVPTWVLLCHDPYWIWLQDRDDSVWYPNVRLFRQDKPNNWRSVIDQVKNCLIELHKNNGLAEHIEKSTKNISPQYNRKFLDLPENEPMRRSA